MCTGCACATPWVDAMADAFTLWNRRASDKREGEGIPAAVTEFVQWACDWFTREGFTHEPSAIEDCHGNKCRLPQCVACNGDAAYESKEAQSHIGGIIEKVRAALSQPKPAGEAGRCVVSLHVKGRELTISERDGKRHYLAAWYTEEGELRFQEGTLTDDYAAAYWLLTGEAKPPEPKTGEGA